MKSLDDILDDIILRLRAGTDPDTGWVHVTQEEAKQQIIGYIQERENQARIDEWNLISETLHAAQIEGEFFLHKAWEGRIKELREKLK